MNIKKGKNFRQFKTYQIPDQKIQKNILDIINQKNEILYFSKPNIRLNLSKKKIFSDNYPSKKLTKLANNRNSNSNQKSYFINNKPVPPLFKRIINSKKLNINKINSDKNNSNKILQPISLNLLNIIKEKNKSRPLSSCSNGNKSSTIKIVSKSLLDKNYTNINNNRPMSSNVKNNNKINFFNGSTKYDSEKDLDRLRYQLKNKSEIFGGENLKYKYNFNDTKQSITSSFEKLNSFKNSLMPRSNRMNFSNINKEKLKYYSIDNQSKNNSNYIRKYFFYKNEKTKSLDYIFENKNNNNLICYKNVFYSTRKGSSDTLNKIKLYNDLIRSRNTKNIHNKKMSLEKGKRYSFYKYKEYMNQIEKEDIKLYKKEKERKDLINIREIFCNTSSRNNSLIIKGNQNEQNINKNNDNINQDLKGINIIKKENIIKEENTIKENKKIKNNQNISRKNSPKKKKNPKRKIKRKKVDDDSKYTYNSYSQSDIVINNFDSGATNKKSKIANAEIRQKENSFKNIIKENILDPEINNKSIRKKTEPAEPPPEKKEDYITEILENNINITEFDNQVSTKNKQKSKNIHIIDIVKDNYLQKREELMKRNKLNLMAQKLLLQKIKEAEKLQKGKRPSQFSHFFNLKYKNLEDDLQNKEKMILNKYYKKISNKKYNVRLRNKNSISFYNNTNNSMNSSINDYMEQLSEFNNFLKQNIDKKDESINILNNLDLSNNDNKNNEENNDIIDLVNEKVQRIVLNGVAGIAAEVVGLFNQLLLGVGQGVPGSLGGLALGVGLVGALLDLDGGDQLVHRGGSGLVGILGEGDDAHGDHRQHDQHGKQFLHGKFLLK